MPKWGESMSQAFEYFSVHPDTWLDEKPIRDVLSCSINRDATAETLGSASLSCGSDLGETYIRAYLTTIQNGIKERFPIGTVLIQTPSISFDGKSHSIDMDAYSPLMELKEKMPPIGYTVRRGQNIMEVAYQLCRSYMRAPVTPAKCSDILVTDFVADTSDTWLSFISDLISQAKYTLELDAKGNVTFAPVIATASMQPVCTFDDGNSSILYSDVTVERDLYGIPNVVEVLYSSSDLTLFARVVNDDPNSPTSTVNRGREIIYRDTNPSFSGTANQAQINEYAQKLLREKSALEYTVKYSHGYNGNRVGDCVRLNYDRANLRDIKAKVISQDIECSAGCKVTETATYTVNMWK